MRSLDTEHAFGLRDWPQTYWISLRFICEQRTRTTGLAGGVAVLVSTWTWEPSIAQGTDPHLAQMRQQFGKSVTAYRGAGNPSRTCTWAFLLVNVLLGPKSPWRPAPGRSAQSR